MAIAAGVTAALDAAIVRLRDRDGRVVGAGFLVGSAEIVTCAHVVERALGHREPGTPPPEATVAVDFPLLAPTVMLTATVVRWQPPLDSGGGGDIAGLQLQDAPPAGARALRLVTAPELWAHRFRTFGFPARHDGGVWASGQLLSREGTGWVQLEDVKTTGFRVEPGFSGAPVWDDELGGVVGMAVAAEARPEARAAFMIPAETLLAAWPDLAHQLPPPCPYRGLEAFREEDKDLFFGRDDLVGQLVSELGRQPLLAVIGPSGSGKSSLVFAGAVPEMRRQAEWVVAAMRPATGVSPLAGLASALLPVLEPEMTETQRLREVRDLEAVLAEGRLAEVADRVRARAGAKRLLLIVDQFEELYGRDQTTIREFIDLLVQPTAGQPARSQPQLVTVLTVRADFLGHTLEYPGLAAALQGRVLLIGRMTRAQLRRVIEGPVTNQVRFEAGLVERILNDVGGEPGNLPLLEFALTLLWERQTAAGLLTHAAYEALGGVDGALARYAEHVYADELAASEREEARRLLVQLVRPGEATEPTRRVARRSELDQARWDAAQQLARTRLVVTGSDERGDETVEVVHEALIAGWGRLRGWVQVDRAFRLWQERVRGTLAEWERTGHDPETLLRGAALPEAERWLEQRPFDISSLERSFIAASRAHQHRGVRRLRAVAAVLAVLLILAISLGVLALVQGRRADDRSRQALSLYLLGRSESQPDLAILLTLAAHKLWPTPQTQGSLLAQLDRRRDASALLSGHSAGLRAVAWRPDGGMLASAGSDDTIRLWNPLRRTSTQLPGGHEGGVSSLAFSTDGQTLAAGGDHDSSIQLWDVASLAQLPALAGRSGGTPALAFSPDEHTLAAGSNDGTVSLWDLDTDRQSPLKGQVHGTPQLAFSGDGRTLVAAGDEDQEIRRWRLPSGESLRPLRHDGDGVRAIALSRDGQTLASAGIPDTIHLWELGPQPRDHILTDEFDSTALAFSPDGQTLASTGDDDRVLQLWDVASGARIRTLTGHTDNVTTMAFSPDGHTLASGGQDRAVALFDVSDLPPSGHTGFIPTIAYSRDGTMLASGGYDSQVIVWDAARRTRLRVLAGHSAEVTGVAFSPDGRLLASTGYDNRVLVWDLQRRRSPMVLPHPPGVIRVAFGPVGRLLALPGSDGVVMLRDLDRGSSHSLDGHTGPLRSVAFSPDGTTLAAGAEDGQVILWDLNSGGSRALSGHTGTVKGVAFSPDGSTLASAGGNVLVRDLARGGPAATLGTGIGVAFSPDGRTLAVGTEGQGERGNSFVVLWGLDDRAPRATLERGIAAVFNPNGGTLATAGQDIVLRNMDTASWQGRLCRLVGRELTKTEWAANVPGRSYDTVCR
jgi:WD40 repeat protein